ncbi:hypothetical protein BDK51DRAFT_49359 [Blyttiomyces helicus]|uniref:SGNH hydrolase-type esterase domain-containing protein n=1 Tax=Blyttiomyces helicus TaxID=388810 RepID=A0A4V1IQC0_9FUNG|nr:hypothetical protein BDK51DRAFT_49359 [Blyttiomyces helicus]|eukprot:RKO86027.1 hypothetical protein BDK51DRAFT_49359 [Blyttiomyces helicus]
MPPGQAKSIPWLKHNLDLGVKLLEYQAEHVFDGTTIVLMDLVVEFASIVLRRQSLGLDMPLNKVEQSCIDKSVSPPSICTDDKHLIWDGTHPTTKVHKALADGAVDLLRARLLI